MNRKLEVMMLESSLEMDHMMSSSDLAIAEVLKQTASETLLVALTGASDFARRRVFSMVTERAQQMLADDLDKVGHIPTEEKIEAQQRILELFRSIPGLKLAPKKLH